MRIGIAGDIHGNAAALRAVSAAARQRGVDALLLTGDFVGYYYRPAEVLAEIDRWEHWGIQGNHERMLDDAAADAAAHERIVAKYGSGITVALDELSVSQRSWLTALPVSRDIEIDGCRFRLAHGTPWDADEYLYPDAGADRWAALAEDGVDFVVLGHTHHRLLRQVGTTTVVNPGSVGQPRDRQPGAAWAFVDTRDRKVELLTEAYDMQSVVEEAARRDPRLPYLQDVLVRQ
jgi:putative phosphoesterase